jgi:EmrB/QacA subfamily drug resistance transporter
VSNRQALVPFSGAMLGMLLAALDQTIVATALPRIVADLNGLNHLSWVVTAYLVTSTVTVPLYGKLSDLYGRKRLFMIAITLFLVGSALCGAAQTMTELILFRGLQGLGAGGLIPLTFAVIGDLFSPRERGRFQGLTGAVWAVAAVVGPLLGGYLTDSASWRWIFYINLPVGVIALVVVATTMHIPSHRREHRIDYPGAALLTAGTVLLLLAAVWGGQNYPWGSAQILGLLLGGGALIAAFLAVETRAAEPILPLALFSNSIFAVSSAATLVIGAVLFGALIYIPLFVQGVTGGSATNSGVVLIPLSLGWVLTSVVSGYLISRTGRYRRFPIAGSLIVVVGFWLLTRMDIHTSSLTTTGDMLVIGFGMGLVAQTYVLAVQNAVPPREMGTATASVLFFRSIGGAFAVAAFGSILTTRLRSELAVQLGHAANTVDVQRILQAPGSGNRLGSQMVDGIRSALSSSLHSVFVVCFVLALVALVVSVLLRELPLRTQTGLELRDEPASAAPSRLDGAADPRPSG